MLRARCVTDPYETKQQQATQQLRSKGSQETNCTVLPPLWLQKKTFPQVSTSENTVSIKLMLPRVSPQVRNSSESSGLSHTGWLSQRQALNFPYYSIKLHQPTNETSSVQFILVGKVTELKHGAGLLALPWLCYHAAPQKATTQ